jgi:hypothetical protein
MGLLHEAANQIMLFAALFNKGSIPLHQLHYFPFSPWTNKDILASLMEGEGHTF